MYLFGAIKAFSKKRVHGVYSKIIISPFLRSLDFGVCKAMISPMAMISLCDEIVQFAR